MKIEITFAWVDRMMELRRLRAECIAVRDEVFAEMKHSDHPQLTVNLRRMEDDIAICDEMIEAHRLIRPRGKA